MKKKASLLILCTIFLCGLASAQENESSKKGLEPIKLRHRISLSYGDGQGVNLGAPRGHFPGMKSYEASSMGSFNLDYLYMLPSGRWGFGIGVGLTPTTLKPFYGIDYSLSHLLLAVVPRVQCTYFRSKLVELYGSASVGVMTSVTPNANLWALAWQLDPIGLRVGSERIAGFVSVGYGSRGIVNVGIQVAL